MKEIKEAFESIPGTQVSFDVAWSPNCIDLRCYDYVGLANYTDFLFVMGYDLRSQIFGPCTASANSPLMSVFEGVQGFLDLNISPDQLVLGVPWYGYDYLCLNSNSTTQSLCDIKHVPFRGVNCSDAAGSPQAYYTIRQLELQSTTGKMWDPDFESPWLNYVDNDGKIHQVWYDDPKSLKFKYKLAKYLQFRGIGVWEMNEVYYGNDEVESQETKKMWNAFKEFLDN